MPLFEYTGVDTRGATVQGSVEAESAWALIPELRAVGDGRRGARRGRAGASE